MPPSQSAVLAALNTMAFNPRAELRLRASAYAQPAAGQGGVLAGRHTRRRDAPACRVGEGRTPDVAVRGSDGAPC
jgi:hypothetical protein